MRERFWVSHRTNLGWRAPLHRPIDADDVGGAAAYLLSDDARNVTGTVLYVDSGYHAMGM